MAEKYFVASKNVLGLCANVDSPKWSFGINTPETGREEYDDCILRMRLNVGPVERFSGNDHSSDPNMGKYHYFSGVPEEDTLYYQRSFLLGSELQIEVDGLLTDEPCVNVNSNYYRYITHRFMNLHSIGYILTDIAALLLLRRGFAPIHCSAFRKGDATVAVFAPPNTGKTLTTMMACMDHDADFLAEDIAITDGKMLYSVPWTSTFRYYSNVDDSLVSRTMNKLTRVFPPLELLPVSKPKPINEFVEDRRIADSAKITHVVVLERGQEAVTSEDRDEIAWKIINLNRYEFCYTKSPLITAYEFFNPSLNIDAARNAEHKILRRTVKNAQECLLVRSPDATRYASLILEALSDDSIYYQSKRA